MIVPLILYTHWTLISLLHWLSALWNNPRARLGCGRRSLEERGLQNINLPKKAPPIAKRTNYKLNTYHRYSYIYIYIYICVCVCIYTYICMYKSQNGQAVEIGQLVQMLSNYEAGKYRTDGTTSCPMHCHQNLHSVRFRQGKNMEYR